MANDWLYRKEQWSFSVKQFYTGLQWVDWVKIGLQKEPQPMTSIYDLFTVDLVRSGNKKIFIEGEKIVWSHF